jgi:hypothetical protein
MTTPVHDDFVPKRPSRTGSWDRAVVFDPKRNEVRIQRKSEIRDDPESGRQIGYTRSLVATTLIFDLDQKYCELKLPKRKKNVTLVVEEDDGMKLRIDEERKSNTVFLARLNLDHLGIGNRALFLLGKISTLYVTTNSG